MLRSDRFFDDLPVPRLSRWACYGITIALVVVALALRIEIGPRLAGLQFITLAPVIIVATWLAGVSGGLLSMAVATAVTWLYMIPAGLWTAPPFAWQTPVAEAAGLVIVGLTGMLRAALLRVRDLNVTLAATFDGHPDGLLIIDPDDRIVSCNQRAAEMFGHPPATLAGVRLASLLAEGSRPRHRARLAGLRADPPERVRAEPIGVTGLRADGSGFPAEVQVGPLATSGCALLMATVRDVTQQRAVAATLEASRLRQAMLEERARAAEAARRWADAFHNAAFGIAIWDAATGTVEAVNPAGAALCGVPAETLQGRPVLDTFVAEEWDRVRALIAEADRTGHAAFDTIHACADRPPFPARVDVTSVAGADGAVRYRIVTTQDITDLKRAEAIAAEKQVADERFRRIFDESPIGMVLATAEDYCFVRVNETFARMLGYAAADLVGRRRADITHPEDVDLPDPIEPGDSSAWYSRDKRYLHASGRVVVCRVRVVRLDPVGSDPALVLGLAEDVTLQRQTERALQRAQQMEAVGTLAGGMAHDFNNLLAIIVANLDALLEAGGLEPGQVEHVRDALDGALRGADLTRSLLAFARRQPLQPTELDLNALISGLAQMLRRLLLEDVTVTLDLAADLWPVVADRAQLEAALLNLAGNARDAMPNGGRLRIATANRALNAEYCTLHPDLHPGDYAMIEVADDGIGMSPDVLARIFEPFFTTKHVDKGTGLGLSMVFGFVHQSGGHIEVYSEVGTGAVFRLYLPRTLAAAPAVTEPLDTPCDPRGDGVSVLVVEDNAGLRRMAMRQLRELGYQPIEADCATAALAVLADQPIDLLFTDVIMPGGMSGVELAERALALRPGLRVLLTSGYPRSMADRGGRCADGRPLPMLQKPYRKGELARTLRGVLDG